MTDLRVENQSRDVDWSKDEKSMKLGDDAMAEESYWWVCLAYGIIGFIDNNFD